MLIELKANNATGDQALTNLMATRVFKVAKKKVIQEKPFIISIQIKQLIKLPAALRNDAQLMRAAVKNTEEGIKSILNEYGASPDDCDIKIIP